MKNKIASLALVAVFFFSFFQMINIGNITSDSMDPEFRVGNKVVINRLSYVKKNPSRGDIIAFEKDGQKLIKRIIGIEGDKIESIDGTVLINGYVLEEDYIEENMETNFVNSFEVPEGCYFVLGDNREISYDARYWDEAYISREDIIGRVVYCFAGIPGKNINSFDTVVVEATK